MFHFEEPNDWAELVFHVLAHVRGTAHLPASVYDETYVSFVESHVGPAATRTLAEDAAALTAALPNHETLARGQLVARLFDSIESAMSHAATDLEDLGGAATTLRLVARGAELLRCAALLEADTFATLPAATRDLVELNAALEVTQRVSPTLADHKLMLLRPLRLRGRLFHDEIWLGAPDAVLGPSAEHVAWQAAHEASVGEVACAAHRTAERGIEHIALVLMTERAADAGLADAHAHWLAHFGELPTPQRDALNEPSRAILTRIRSLDAGA